MLVPLNFLAIAAFTQLSPSNQLATIAGETISVLLFAALCYIAGRVIAPASGLALLAAAVMLPSVIQLFERRWIDATTRTGELLLFGSVPLAVYLGSNLKAIWGQRIQLVGTTAEACDSDPTESAAATKVGAAWIDETLMFLGLSTFAALLPLGLMLAKTGRVESALHELAVLVWVGDYTARRWTAAVAESRSRGVWPDFAPRR